MTTHRYEEEEEDEDGYNLNFKFCGFNVEGIYIEYGGDGKIPDSWILLDNQSAINVFNNKSLLTNIRKVYTERKYTVIRAPVPQIWWVTLQDMELYGITD